MEIDEAYIGGGLRHHGSKVAQASKTTVIGMAERNGRVHLESMSNRRFESIKPVLDAKPEGRSDRDRQKLADVQRATRAEIDRYRGYGSAEELVVNFKRDLHSTKIHAELRQLGLPTLEDVRDEFERKAQELGVGAGS